MRNCQNCRYYLRPIPDMPIVYTIDGTIRDVVCRGTDDRCEVDRLFRPKEGVK